MKRKRFIKILMCLGVTRNDAEASADYARNMDGSYAAGFARYWRLCKELFPEIARTVEITHPHISGMAGGGTQ